MCSHHDIYADSLAQGTSQTMQKLIDSREGLIHCVTVVALRYVAAMQPVSFVAAENAVSAEDGAASPCYLVEHHVHMHIHWLLSMQMLCLHCIAQHSIECCWKASTCQLRQHLNSAETDHQCQHKLPAALSSELTSPLTATGQWLANPLC